MKNIVYFDLETRHSAAEVGGWHQLDKMRMSVGVTYSTQLEQYKIYREEDVDELIYQLRHADLVVGFNHVSFDYGVLQRYTMWSLLEMTNNLDLLKDLESRIGHRIKLDSVAKASLGNTKTAEGIQALKWWAEYAKTGNIDTLMEIARYCCFDVKVTKEVHQFGQQNGFIRYDSKSGEILQQAIEW